MTDSLINVGELSKPATVLIEKVSEAVGGVFKPYQIRRIAQAEAEAEIIKATAQIEIEERQRRAMQRFLAEETAKQQNMETITGKAIPLLAPDAAPENMDKDWISNFFDKCRLVSDDEMQSLWSRVLAGEASAPGAFSKRTVGFLASLDKSEAQMFMSLCKFCWAIGQLTALVMNTDDLVYEVHGINFGTLTHLDSIGLIQFNSIAGFRRLRLPKSIKVFYYDKMLELTFAKDVDNELDLGEVLLTQMGMELARICSSTPANAFFEYMQGRWAGLLLASVTNAAPESRSPADAERDGEKAG